ncbi:hypothetical protein RDI58_018165 [Solanum bulbocastanum]|uniref:Uncharacterized protein n=1 Tax=Solanum bulbocastanum TaxID=147425 RepID=A0AAN8TCL2_SOLBU
MSRPSADQGWRTMNKKFLTFEKEHMQADVQISLSTDDVMESTPTFETISCIRFLSRIANNE